MTETARVHTLIWDSLIISPGHTARLDPVFVFHILPCFSHTGYRRNIHGKPVTPRQTNHSNTLERHREENWLSPPVPAVFMPAANSGASCVSGVADRFRELPADEGLGTALPPPGVVGVCGPPRHGFGELSGVVCTLPGLGLASRPPPLGWENCRAVGSAGDAVPSRGDGEGGGWGLGASGPLAP